MYLTPQGNQKLKPKLEDELEEGTEVVSNSFEIEGWEYSSRVILRDRGNKIGEMTCCNVFGILYFYEIGKNEKKGNSYQIIVR